ncbi:MAG TPA: hypothetical protein PL124_12415 [Candidatus Cloacimonadota bacterium]|nr:hypothetical protein [Candidatus Cloacimonadota bacterium]
MNTGLRTLRNVIMGQGIFPCNVTGLDDDGNEVLSLIQDKEVIAFCGSRMVRRYFERALRDYLKFGRTFPELLPNSDGSKIVGINTINAYYARLTEANAMGEIERCIVSGDWPENPKPGYKTIPVLSDYDPYEDLQSRRLARQLGKSSLIYPLTDSWSNRDYYSHPIWWSAKLAGWIDIAHQIPLFIRRMYENAMAIKWHVRIPYAFWDKMFPKSSYPDDETRKAAINNYQNKIEENLCSADKAGKALFTGFELGPQGKAEEQWEIDELKTDMTAAEKLTTSAASNSEILFTLMINPNLLGAGMPGGTYAGNQGGSNIREAFLVNIANAWIDRQNLLDPLECMLRYNGVTDVELRFRNTILTTLDTGAGTKKVLS